MSRFMNDNPRFGFEGPFIAESKKALADEMKPTFVVWAEEAWDSYDEGEMTKKEFVEAEMEALSDEFIGSLRRVK